LAADAVALQRRIDDHLRPVHRAAVHGVVVGEHAVGSEVLPGVEIIVALPAHDETGRHADHAVSLSVEGDELALREHPQVRGELLRRPGFLVRVDAPAQVPDLGEVARLGVADVDPTRRRLVHHHPPRAGCELPGQRPESPPDGSDSSGTLLPGWAAERSSGELAIQLQWITGR
jgi:hypothetical protein